MTDTDVVLWTTGVALIEVTDIDWFLSTTGAALEEVTRDGVGRDGIFRREAGADLDAVGGVRAISRAMTRIDLLVHPDPLPRR